MVASTMARVGACGVGEATPLTNLLFPRVGGRIPHSLQMFELLPWGTGVTVWLPLPSSAGSFHRQETSARDLGATHHLWFL